MKAELSTIRRLVSSWAILYFFVGALLANEFPGDILGPLPERFEIQAVGTYRGFEKVNLQLDNSGHTTREVQVIVDRPNIPVVLVLTAYDPVVWRVGRTEDTRIAGILVSGYHGQALIGIDEDTPFAISSSKERGSFPAFFATGASDELLRMDAQVNAMLGQRITLFQNEPVDETFVVGSPVDIEEVIFSDYLKLDDYRDSDRPLAGQEALDRLVDQGKIRLASDEEIETWISKASEPYAKFNPSLRVREHPQFNLPSGGSSRLASRTYFVLEKFTLPNGLHGSHSRAFLLPSEVHMPDGPLGHNTFYLMDGTKTHRAGRRPQTRPIDETALASFFDGMPREFELYAVGTYAGSVPLESIQLDDSAHDVTRAEVIVNQPGTPVVLVLTAYDPVVWRVGITEGTQLAGVIVSGYHGQALIGIPEEVPRMISSYETGGEFKSFYAFRASQRLLDTNERLNALSGQDIDFFYTEPTEEIFEVGLPRDTDQVAQYSNDLSLDLYIDPDRPLSGQRGIDQLVEGGKLRPATMLDINQWIDQESVAFQALSPGIRISSYLRPEGAYVVLEEMTFPTGLFGAHALSFLVPTDIPIPAGDPGHSRILRIEADVAVVSDNLIVDFESWTKELQETLGVEEEFAANSDLDKDGQDDLIEFLMGSNPLDPTSRGRLTVSLDQIGGSHFVGLFVPIRNNSTGIHGVLETSTNGLQWQEVEDGFEMVDRTPQNRWSDLVHLRATRSVSTDSGMNLFRLRAVLPNQGEH